MTDNIIKTKAIFGFRGEIDIEITEHGEEVIITLPDLNEEFAKHDFKITRVK